MGQKDLEVIRELEGFSAFWSEALEARHTELPHMGGLKCLNCRCDPRLIMHVLLALAEITIITNSTATRYMKELMD